MGGRNVRSRTAQAEQQKSPSTPKPLMPAQAVSHPILKLHQTVGNQKVQQLRSGLNVLAILGTHALSALVSPDYLSEFSTIQRWVEKRLARELDDDEKLLLIKQLQQRKHEKDNLAIFLHNKALLRAHIEELDFQRQAILARQRGGTYVRIEDIGAPSYWKEFWEQAKWNLNPMPLLRNLGAYMVHVGNVSIKLQKQNLERGGNPLAGPFMPIAVMTVESLESISDDLNEVTFRIEKALEAESLTDAAIESGKALLGLGKAAFTAYGLVDMFSGFSVGGPGMGPGAEALVTTAGETGLASGGRQLAPVAPLSETGIAMAIINNSEAQGRGAAEASPEKTLPEKEAPEAAANKKPPEPKPGATRTAARTKVAVVVSTIQRGFVRFRLKSRLQDVLALNSAEAGAQVYTIRNAQGQIIYVGYTERGGLTRLGEHLAEKIGEFLGQASSMEIRGIGLLQREGLALEQDLIQFHQPQFNKQQFPFRDKFGIDPLPEDVLRAYNANIRVDISFGE